MQYHDVRHHAGQDIEQWPKPRNEVRNHAIPSQHQVQQRPEGQRKKTVLTSRIHRYHSPSDYGLRQSVRRRQSFRPLAAPTLFLNARELVTAVAGTLHTRQQQRKGRPPAVRSTRANARVQASAVCADRRAQNTLPQTSANITYRRSSVWSLEPR